MNRRRLLGISAITAWTGVSFKQRNRPTKIVKGATRRDLDARVAGEHLPNAPNDRSQIRRHSFFDAVGDTPWCWVVVTGLNSSRPISDDGELAAATIDFLPPTLERGHSTSGQDLTLRYDGALRPNNEGTDVKPPSPSGDELSFSIVHRRLRY